MIANVGTSLADEMGFSADLVGSAVLAAVVTLAVPAGIVLWRVLSDLGIVFAQRLIIRAKFGKLAARVHAADVVGTGLVSVLLIIASVWMVTQLLEMMPVADLTSPVPALVMVMSAGVTATVAMKIHSQMDKTFRRTLLGDASGANSPSSDSSASAGD